MTMHMKLYVNKEFLGDHVWFSSILIVIAILATVGVLVVGLFGVRGGKFNSKILINSCALVSCFNF